jgi:uncharacterized protein (TIGR00251 family)
VAFCRVWGVAIGEATDVLRAAIPIACASSGDRAPLFWSEQAAKTTAPNAIERTRIQIRIAAPPVDGAANQALVRFLSRLLGVPARNIEVVSGSSARRKRVRVLGVTPAQAHSRLAIDEEE